MTATSTLLACSNVGDCIVAGKSMWDQTTVACPRCGKMLSSPHSVSILPFPGNIQENSGFAVLVNAKDGGNCAKVEDLWLEINGARRITAKQVTVPGETTFAISGGLPYGLHGLRAVLVTSDGRTTVSNERPLFISGGNALLLLLISLLLLILLAIFLVSLAANFGWFGATLLDQRPGYQRGINAISILSAMLSVGLLVILVLRQRRRPGRQNPKGSVEMTDRGGEP